MAEKAGQLEELRAELARLDSRLVDLVGERQRLVSRIGRTKAEAGMPTRDYRQEKEVYERVRRDATARGVEAKLVDGLFALLIRSSLARQERDRVEAGSSGSGRRALVIGGAGRMGGWFVRFLASQGFTVEVADPAGEVEGFRSFSDWRGAGLDQDVIVVASPLEQTARILSDLAALRPSGLVFDIASLKGPLRAPLRLLRDAGVRVTSIHPMFGPDTELLSSRHVIFVEVGSPEATNQARELFASTMANRVDMEFEDHDRLIAFVLGLSHALNLSFATALSESGEQVPRLAEISSTTFDAQLEVAARVASESPDLYYEIQALNECGAESLDALSTAVERLRAAVQSNGSEEFTRLMLAGRAYLQERLGSI